MTPSEINAPRGVRIRIEYTDQPLYRYGSYEPAKGWFTTQRKRAPIVNSEEMREEGLAYFRAALKEQGVAGEVSLEEVASFDPDWCTPPGGTIRECMEQTPLTEAELAEKLGLPDVKGLLEGETVINPELAQKLSDTLGGSQPFWIALDGNYREGLRKGLTVMR